MLFSTAVIRYSLFVITYNALLYTVIKILKITI